jgi:HK97 gp10 family phage protein
MVRSSSRRPKSAAEMVGTAKSFAPVKSGALRDSVAYTFGEYRPANSNVRGVTGGGSKLNDPDLTVTIHAGDADAYYAAFVEFGTTSHKIEAKAAPALHLYGGDYVESVNHPGASARPFFFPAWRLVKKKVKGRVSRATTRAAKKVAAAS